MVPKEHACLFYIAPEREITDIFQNDKYFCSSLASEGFIHLCEHQQVELVRKNFFDDVADLKLVIIDSFLLESEVVYEKAAVNDSDDLQSMLFPHLYGPLDRNAIVDVIDLIRFNHKSIHPDTLSILEHYRFDRLPVEGTLYKSTWRAVKDAPDGGPCGTAMIGLYCEVPESVSCFHKLEHEEVWHVYGGDPFTLYLLYPDGSTEEISMGTDISKGQLIQYVIPAGVWQAGCLDEGGRYALFGCTMAPGFTGDCFQAGVADELIALYPTKRDAILKLSVNGHQKNMPAGFAT